MPSLAQKAIGAVIAPAIGFVVLIPFCLAQAWEPCMSTENPFGREPREIDRWKWAPLNAVWGNPEDGVSGAKALVWVNGVRVPYMPGAWAPWRAYCWQARNTADQLKYTYGT